MHKRPAQKSSWHRFESCQNKNKIFLLVLFFIDLIFILLMLHFSLTSLSTVFQSYNDSQLLYDSDLGRLLWNGFAVLSDMQIIIFKFRVWRLLYHCTNGVCRKWPFNKKNGPAHNNFDTYQIFELQILSRAFACAQHSQSPRCLHTQRTVKKKAQAKLRRLSPLCSWPCMFSKRLNAYAKTTKYSCACSLSVSIKCHQPL